MNYRTLGNTGLEVSDIGFGAWGIGGKTAGATSYGETDDQQSLAALRCAFDHGVTFYDTAHVYGNGRSESLIEAAFRGRRHDVVIATKAGRDDYSTNGDYSAASLRRSLEESLSCLRTDYVDLLQLHSPPMAGLVDSDCLEELKRFQSEGKIRCFGIATRSPDDAIVAIRDYDFPVVQVNFNLLDQRAADGGLLTVATERQTGVIARTPLCFGLLTGTVNVQTVFDPSDHRSAWPREQIERWIEGSRLFLGAVSNRDVQTESQVALRFCLSFPGVSTVIPGMLKTAEVLENASASDMGPLSASDLEQISRIYHAADFFVRNQ